MPLAGLPQLSVRRGIFHDIPTRNRLAPDAVPVLCDIETALNDSQKEHLRIRLNRVLSSRLAYPVVFSLVTTSPVPTHVRAFTQEPLAETFVPMSRDIAAFLCGQQNGAVSAGLLCVLDVALGARSAVVFMKLEREQGAQLQLRGDPGRKTFDMSVLDNLVLTDGTRLFKTAIFVRTGPEEDDFEALACDEQLKPTASSEMAKFWMRFLGCQFVLEPRIATQRFYDAALTFINEHVSDPVEKNDLYEHLHSQLKAPGRQLSPQRFIQEYVPTEYRRPFGKHLTDLGVQLSQFTKDLADIQTRLRRAHYTTVQGAVLSVPAEKVDIVDVQQRRIVVADALKRVDHK